jgi:hypothetical protein
MCGAACSAKSRSFSTPQRATQSRPPQAQRQVANNTVAQQDNSQVAAQGGNGAPDIGTILGLLMQALSSGGQQQQAS